jgi:hypothetical protein
MFIVEATSPMEATLRAVTAEGEVLWKQESPGTPLMGDSFGGVIAGMPDPFSTESYLALVRLGSAGGVRPWRYESRGVLVRPAQGPDGTLFAIEYVASSDHTGNEVWDKHAVVIDGTTGRLLGRRVLAREVESFTSEFDGLVVSVKPRIVCRSTRWEQAPATVGPIVGSDGRGFLLVRRHVKHKFDTCTEQHSRPRRTIDDGIDLLVLSPRGTSHVEVIYAAACDVDVFEFSPCDLTPELKQLLPDGVGGLLSVWDRLDQVSLSAAVRRRILSRRDDQGTRRDVEINNTSLIHMVGQAGISYVFASGSWSAVDTTSWTTKWTANLGTSGPLAALPDGGLSIFDFGSQIHRTVDATGVVQADSAIPLPLESPVQEFGSWIGLSSGGLMSIFGRADDSTRWFFGLGNRQGQSAVRKPGLGVFAKAHLLSGFLPFIHHSSIRITPSDPLPWLSHPKFGKYFREFVDDQGQTRPAVDIFGNPSATLGAGPHGLNGEDTTSMCLVNSILESAPNRSRDQLNPPMFSRALALRGSENFFIERLFELDAKYADFLTYECLPDGPDEFNSNSYVSGLLGAADISKPFFPTQFPMLFPGWSKPVPATYFGQ